MPHQELLGRALRRDWGRVALGPSGFLSVAEGDRKCRPLISSPAYLETSVVSRASAVNRVGGPDRAELQQRTYPVGSTPSQAGAW